MFGLLVPQPKTELLRRESAGPTESLRSESFFAKIAGRLRSWLQSLCAESGDEDRRNNYSARFDIYEIEDAVRNGTPKSDAEQALIGLDVPPDVRARILGAL